MAWADDSVVVMPVAGTLARPTLEALTDVLAVTVQRVAGKRVVTKEDVEAQLERGKLADALGCTDIQCAAELAGSLGSRYLLTAKARKLGDQVILTLSLIDTKTQRATRAQSQTPNDERHFATAVESATRELFGLAATSGSVPGAPLWAEDFKDNKKLWPIENDVNTCISSIKDGAYIVESRVAHCCWETITVSQPLPERFDVAWKTQWQQGDDNHANGLTLGSSANAFYQFVTTANGKAVVWSWVDSKPGPEMMPWRVGILPASDGRRQDSHRVEIRDKNVSYFLNGTFVTRFVSTIDLRAGTIGYRVCGKQKAALREIIVTRF